jgi:hypothetical protein
VVQVTQVNLSMSAPCCKHSADKAMTSSSSSILKKYAGRLPNKPSKPGSTRSSQRMRRLSICWQASGLLNKAEAGLMPNICVRHCRITVMTVAGQASASPKDGSLRSRLGLHNREIADRSGLTEGTVKVHHNRICRKRGIDSRMQLILDFAEAK